MIRRQPTRIELKLEDLEEFEKLYKSSTKKSAGSPGDMVETPVAKTKQQLIDERIGAPRGLPRPEI